MSLGLPLSRLRDSSPDKVSLYSFCELNAAPLGEVASAICAEAGGVKLNFIKISRKPLSHGQAVTAPLTGRRDEIPADLSVFFYIVEYPL